MKALVKLLPVAVFLMLGFLATAKAEVTPISAIQGSGLQSPMEGGSTRYTVEAVVTATFPGLGGYFVEEEAADADDSGETSEGLFVRDPALNVKPGDLVRVTGRVEERGRGRGAETRLTDVTVDRVDDSRDFREELAPPLNVALPQPSLFSFESFEGMRVVVKQQLYVSDTYYLGHYGEVMLSADAPLTTPTAVATPGKAASDKGRANRCNQLLIDDGVSSTLARTSTPRVPYLDRDGDLTLRRGSVFTGVVGVLTQGPTESYRVHPTKTPEIEYAARPLVPNVRLRPDDLVVASFNVLNYFVTIDDGANGARGADSESERTRQKAKIVSAITAIDADIYGLMEIEKGDRAIEDLAAGLPDHVGLAAPPGFESVPGADYPVRVGFLYRPSAVEPVGESVALVDASFEEARPPIAQTFRHRSTGELVTVVACHLKSKGRPPAEADHPDIDQRDGQGAWNATRTEEARALVAFVDRLKGERAGGKVLVVGDFNAYPLEDPIRTLRDGGLTAISEADSYVHYGGAGALDYLFGTPEAASRVVEAAVWNLNSSEPRALDYNDDVRELESDTHESINPEPDLYDPGPYRSSDHDAVVVGLRLGIN